MVKRIFYSLFILFSYNYSNSQQLYFPPVGSETWETTSPEELNWCTDEIPALLDFLEETNTRAFLVLKDGKIVIEEYLNGNTTNTPWYWASAGKSLTAFLVGMAQQEGYLDINESSTNYLGEGWTSLTPEEELAITIRHQLTMTSGLDDGVEDIYCTNPECLTYLAAPGTRWAYHNAPYTLLDSVIFYSTGQSINSYLSNTLSDVTGINALFLPNGFNNVCYSRPRAFARFGILMLGEGTWNGTPIMTDMQYFNDMITPSNDLNESYGYLWWLNSQDSFMIPSVQWVFPGTPMEAAPLDMYSALGKNGQILNIVPSQNLLVVRMGDAPDGNEFLVPTAYNNEIWEKLNMVICNSVATEEMQNSEFKIYPNPTEDIVYFDVMHATASDRMLISNMLGSIVYDGAPLNQLSVREFDSGVYEVQLFIKNSKRTSRFIVR
jgi:CubicO group peptidase (beta-lactamase class C family)